MYSVLLQRDCIPLLRLAGDIRNNSRSILLGRGRRWWRRTQEFVLNGRLVRYSPSAPQNRLLTSDTLAHKIVLPPNDRPAIFCIARDTPSKSLNKTKTLPTPASSSAAAAACFAFAAVSPGAHLVSRLTGRGTRTPSTCPYLEHSSLISSMISWYS
jgi:hypothetical protein